MSLGEMLRRTGAAVARPAAAFDGLASSRTAWLVPSILVGLLMLVPTQTLLRPLYLERQLVAIDRLVERGVLTEEQAHEATGRMQDSAGARGAASAILPVVLGLVLHLVLRCALPAALLLAGLSFALETRARYATVLGVVGLASVPAGLREILRVPLQALNGTLDVYFSPAVLTGTRGVGGFALNFLDVFDLWILALLILGLSVATGIPRGRAAMLVLPLWGIYCLLKLGQKISPLGAAL
jgi:hypothetical protein